MKPEEQRIAIAEWCGWKIAYNDSCHCYDHYRPDQSWAISAESKRPDILPNYLNDLNAMWQAEEKLHGSDWARYFNWIQANGNGSGVHATAPQRAEALLRTIGKWEEKT